MHRVGFYYKIVFVVFNTYFLRLFNACNMEYQTQCHISFSFSTVNFLT